MFENQGVPIGNCGPLVISLGDYNDGEFEKETSFLVVAFT